MFARILMAALSCLSVSHQTRGDGAKPQMLPLQATVGPFTTPASGPMQAGEKPAATKGKEGHRLKIDATYPSPSETSESSYTTKQTAKTDDSQPVIRSWHDEAETTDRDFGAAPPAALSPEETRYARDTTAEKKSVSQESEEEIEGIDTADLPDPQGNWLFKRIWWERAEARYEQVRTDAERVTESRMKFFTQRTDVDRNVLDPFYIKVGFKRGELLSAINRMVSRLEEDREREGELSEKERVTLALLKEEERQLKKLAESTERITQIDGQIDSTLAKLTEAINRVRRHERNAWESFREIAHTLSDERARELFFKIDEAWRNINNIRLYIDDQLYPYFTRIIKDAQTGTTEIIQTIDALRAHGVTLVKEDAKETTAPTSPKPAPIDEGEDDDEIEKPEPGILEKYLITPISSLFSIVVTPVQFIWDSLAWIVKTPYNLVFGEQNAQVALEDDDDEE